MEDAERSNDTVHPEVRAYVNSLVSAVSACLSLPLKYHAYPTVSSTVG
jgi:hypothetical protein